MNQGYKPPVRDKKKLLNEIDKASFAIVELNLYLDTHPYDTQALDAIKQFSMIRNQLLKEYTESYGSLVIDCMKSSANQWNWALQEWPWEVNC